MEEDQYIPGNIIYTDGYSIKTSNGQTTSIVVGNATSSGYTEGRGANARFQYIFDILQLTSEELLVPDYSNYCIRHVNRTTGNTTQYIGQCRKSGSGQVQFGVGSLIGYPKYVIRDNQMPHHILFAYRYSSTLYLAHFNMKNKIVSPFIL